MQQTQQVSEYVVVLFNNFNYGYVEKKNDEKMSVKVYCD